MQIRTEARSTLVIEPAGNLEDRSLEAEAFDQLISFKANNLNIVVVCSRVRQIGSDALWVLGAVNRACEHAAHCELGDRIVLVDASADVLAAVRSTGLELKHYATEAAAMAEIEAFHAERERSLGRR